MNPQVKRKGGVTINRGIEWCDYTWNPIGGCKHACRWKMPDGKIAVCYAETTAEGAAQKAYPYGFAEHYWRPDKLDEPLKLKTPSRIFLDSMSDLMGHWVPEAQVRQVLDICRQAHWHTFILLTKNPRLLPWFEFPPNVWVLVSSPPDFMWGKELKPHQQLLLLQQGLSVLKKLRDVRVRGMSVEPLSWDISPYMEECGLQWLIIGAASNGREYYQPDRVYLERLLFQADRQRIPVFFKGNLDWSPWREEFPKEDK